LLDEGYDVFLIDWGYPEEEDADVGIEQYVSQDLESGIREFCGRAARTSWRCSAGASAARCA